MRKSILNFFIAFIVVCTGLQAQSISGSVTDSEDGEPLAGVNIVVQGQNQGAVSDFDGNFTIANFESGSTLVFSYVGYKTLNLKISATDVISDNISVSMDKDLSELDEVIVIGYGSQ